MRRLLMAGLSLALLTTASAGAQEFLTAAQKKSVLSAIDLICADTWCCGDYNYKFYQIYCSSRSQACRLVYGIFPWDNPRAITNFSCDVHRLKGVGDLLKNGRDLQERFYNALTSCFSKNEKRYGKKPARPRPKKKK
jgi:hypothetical protein